MKKKTISRLLPAAIFLTGIVMLTSCDHAQVLIVQAGGESNNSITLYGNREMKGRGASAGPKKVVVRTPRNDTTRRTFYFDMGSWSDTDLDRLAGNIDSIVITNSNGTERLKEKDALKAYLREHRRGVVHSELLLAAK
ncbi:hypothetical protein LL912_06265 [Niabella sp. CC-SYL272]|uniref:hypothetical protein n=1 Tax=Niabella agricola TaxID=2891571 RepID=UPI001F2C3420|nr:hypothetical protein [Niabella agricola]MCF3108374.1 hypothetical protein [Niabella agricola]